MVPDNRYNDFGAYIVVVILARALLWHIVALVVQTWRNGLHTMTGIQALPHSHMECLRASNQFEDQARMLDPHGFAAVTATTQDADLFDWLQWKLRHGLSSWRKPGAAAWKWMTPGKVAKVLVWCTGARESEQTAPYAGEHQYGAQWWPCIVHIPDGDPLAPVLAFYCPALGWANGRPWLVHRSRCFLVPNDYRDIATK